MPNNLLAFFFFLLFFFLFLDLPFALLGMTAVAPSRKLNELTLNIFDRHTMEPAQEGTESRLEVK